MKEAIISLLKAGCKPRIGPEDMHIYLDSTSNVRGDMIVDVTGRRHNIDRSTLKVIQVIPPTPPEYKVGDRVMVYLGKWMGPFEVKAEHDWSLSPDNLPDSLYIEVGNGRRMDVRSQLHLFCEYFEGVNYNPLPTNKE